MMKMKAIIVAINPSYNQAIPVTGHWEPSACETSRLPHFLGNWIIYGGYVVSLTRRQIALYLQEGSWYSYRDWVDPKAIVLLEGLDQMKNPVISSETRTRDVPAFTKAPKPSKISLYLYILPYTISLFLMSHGPPLWSSGQSSWLQIRRPWFDSRHYRKKM
jgi:hypothetical protein